MLLSDLHLPAQPSPLRRAFAHFLEGPARAARQIYILGDLFEYWLGDDVGLIDYAEECERLRALSGRGVPVAFLRGNRDFLVGARFARAAGVELLPDPRRVELDGQPVLLSHGDAWCTDDRGYQVFRWLTRNRVAGAWFLRLPLRWRHGIAERLRAASRRRNGSVPRPIVDVNRAAVARAFAEHGVARIIHGHTHRPADHDEGGGRRRLVLPDWRPGDYGYLHCEAGVCRRRRITIGGDPR
ncbi:MAG: UDP-2,3-diacylglucosamine diphosphatase [Gammaproteobacteria bacterium]|nr:UDP-2,3-diacylglucosamine diphosphatase [Gammaproteobacteria bacterium]